MEEKKEHQNYLGVANKIINSSFVMHLLYRHRSGILSASVGERNQLARCNLNSSFKLFQGLSSSMSGNKYINKCLYHSSSTISLRPIFS